MTQSSSRTSEFLLDGNVAVITGWRQRYRPSDRALRFTSLGINSDAETVPQEIASAAGRIGACLDVNNQAQVASTFGLEDLSFHERQLK